MTQSPDLSTVATRTPATTWDGKHDVLPSARAQFRGSDVPPEAFRAPANFAANAALVGLWKIIGDFTVRHRR
ncbi:hypothetical protein EOD42_14345 [Rhodovarius crocodyli]|uniref:Uncharacterized protein n=1 Tax=Rhodovarius crocodyli TaxID=1979269 RepID=A0A437MF73_9PROT|nr:hypothetical protein [Rhodovarius crocodyli]RVT96287.1 hypothetical protein EOD42_14345 [Rhodovarius crocodyli]